MHHRRHDEREGVRADRQRIALLDDARLQGLCEVRAEELPDHRHRFRVADHGRFRMDPQHLGKGRGVVRLHVVDDYEIQRSAVQRVGQILEKHLRNGAVHGIHKHGAAAGRGDIAVHEIRVVRYAARDRIHVFKQRQPPVTAAQPENVVRYGKDVVHRYLRILIPTWIVGIIVAQDAGNVKGDFGVEKTRFGLLILLNIHVRIW